MAEAAGVVTALSQNPLEIYFLGIMSTVVIYIVKDWVKGLKGKDPVPQVSGTKLVGQINESCMEHERRLSSVENTLETHKRELEDGSKKFDELQKDIKKMSINIATLVERSKQIRSSDKEKSK